VSDPRQLNSISGRYDLELSRRPDPLRLSVARLTWLCAGVSLLACVVWLGSDHRVFQSHCVSPAHRPFEQNCRQCHDRRFTPLERMASFSNNLHSTSAQKCQVCHTSSTGENHLAPALPSENRAPDGVPNVNRQEEWQKLLKNSFAALECAGCHQEHRGHAELSDVADANCVNCHQTAHETHQTGRVAKFDLNFREFFQHPDFALWNPEKKRRELPTKQVDAATAPALVDGSDFRFNHHRHLDPQLPIAPGKTVALSCQDCHQLDDAQAYFRPIEYEQHCRRCHEIGLPETGPLPHAKPDIIQGQLLQQAIQNFKPADSARVRPTDRLGGPTKPPNAGDVELARQLQPDVARIQQRLFGDPQPAGPAAGGLLKSACSKCHITESPRDGGTLWTVSPPNLPDRWLPHSRFRHDRHASLDCGECHTRGGQPADRTTVRADFYPNVPDALAKSSSIFASRTSDDVLLPSIQICHQCHGSQATTQGQAAVSDRCVGCHDFHHGSAQSGRMTLNMLETVNRAEKSR
jgi:hypothetical protein